MSMKDEKHVVQDEEGNFVEGRKYMNLGERRQFKTLKQDNEVKLQGKTTIMKVKDDEEHDEVLWLGNKLIDDWSKEEDVNRDTIKKSYELADLIEEFVDDIIEINNLKPSKEDQEEKN